MGTDIISLTTEKPMEDILNLDLGSHLAPSGEDTLDIEESVEDVNKRNMTGSMETTTETEVGTSEIDRENAEFEKNKEKVR